MSRIYSFSAVSGTVHQQPVTPLNKPEPPEHWSDMRDAVDFRPVCQQGGTLTGNALVDQKTMVLF